jgi:hypothetical protein
MPNPEADKRPPNGAADLFTKRRLRRIRRRFVAESGRRRAETPVGATILGWLYAFFLASASGFLYIIELGQKGLP